MVQPEDVAKFVTRRFQAPVDYSVFLGRKFFVTILLKFNDIVSILVITRSIGKETPLSHNLYFIFFFFLAPAPLRMSRLDVLVEEAATTYWQTITDGVAYVICLKALRVILSHNLLFRTIIYGAHLAPSLVRRDILSAGHHFRNLTAWNANWSQRRLGTRISLPTSSLQTQVWVWQVVVHRVHFFMVDRTPFGKSRVMSRNRLNNRSERGTRHTENEGPPGLGEKISICQEKQTLVRWGLILLPDNGIEDHTSMDLFTFCVLPNPGVDTTRTFHMLKREKLRDILLNMADDAWKEYANMLAQLWYQVLIELIVEVGLVTPELN